MSPTCPLLVIEGTSVVGFFNLKASSPGVREPRLVTLFDPFWSSWS